MNKQNISHGKRPRNPMIKRVWKDIWRDRRRYFLIWLMLVMTIGFVSGTYVANNSMSATLESNFSRLRCEDGHFRLSEKADEDTISAIESTNTSSFHALHRAN